MRHERMRLAQPVPGYTAKQSEWVPLGVPAADERVPALHGVMTGLANLVNEHLEHLTIGPQATRFLRHLERQTFGNAGLHRRAGRRDPGLWSPYAHAEWAQALGVSSSALTHLRTRLVEAGIIWYRPDRDRRGRGAVGWNVDFTCWRPPQWGGARPGAGRPCAASSDRQHTIAWQARRTGPLTHLSGAEEEARDANIQRGHLRPLSSPPGTHPSASSRSKPGNQDVNRWGGEGLSGVFRTSTSAIHDVNQSTARCQQLPGKTSTARLDAPAPPVASQECVRRESPKKERKQRRRTDADASGVHGTPCPACAVPDHTGSSPDQAGVLNNGGPPRSHPSQVVARRVCAGPAGDHLPPPLPYETLRTYWLRIYREACDAAGTEAREMVHAAARALVNMGHTRADYILLAQLRHASGSWSTVLHWLLECAARELADPRTYLRAVAGRHRIGMAHEEQPGRPQIPAARAARCMAFPDDSSDPAVHQTDRMAMHTRRVTVADVPLTDHEVATRPDQPAQLPVAHNQEEGRAAASAARGDARVPASWLCASSEPVAEVHGMSDDSVDDLVHTVYLPVRHLWCMARQRLRADLTAAQYSSWLVNTELYRGSDGSLVLRAGTTFAADLIARRWGQRIQWILSDMTGQVATLSVRAQLPGSDVPEG